MTITVEVFNTIMRVLNSILNAIFSFLPKSPFTSVMGTVGKIPYLEYISYFVPIGEIMSITATWLTAVGVFYVYQIVLRWVKAIDD